MKKLFWLLVIPVLILGLSTNLFAAISSSVVWECRATATAANVNGGGYKTGATGTDYSRQNEAQYNLTGVTTTGANATILTASANSTMVGNVAHITSGGNFTTGWYEVLSTVDGVSATLDRACSTSGGGKSGVAQVGGSMSLNSTLDDDFFEVTISGTTVWLCADPDLDDVVEGFTLGEAVYIALAGTATAPNKIIGYYQVRGDNPTGATRPLITCGTYYFGDSGGYREYKNLILTGSANNIVLYLNGQDDRAVNCKVTQTATTANYYAIGISTYGVVLNCEAISYKGGAISTAADVSIFGCYIHDSNKGIRVPQLNNRIINNIITDCTTSAISVENAGFTETTIIGNTLYGSENTTGIGINLLGATNFVILNNIIYGFATGISTTATDKGTYLDYNDFFNNDADVSVGLLTKGSNDLALDPQFTSVAQVTGTTAYYTGSTLSQAGADFTNVVDNQDFVYIVSGTGVTAGQYLITSHTTTSITTDLDAGENAQGGGDDNIVFQVTTGRNFAIGTNLKAKGFLGAFPGALTTGYLDIGAVQRKEAGAEPVTTKYVFQN